jgi:hypothetical protein
MRGLVLLTLVLAGCAAHTVSTNLRRDQIGSKYARISGYMATRGAAPGGKHTEETPGSIRHDSILDEAVLAKVDAQETCVDLVLRTASGRDEPVDQYQPSFEIDGKKTRAVIENEVVSVYDYTFTGMRETAAVEGVAASQFIGMSLQQPTDQIFRVIERRARVCGGLGGNVRQVKLDVTHPSWDVADYNYHLDFDWKLD